MPNLLQIIKNIFDEPSAESEQKNVPPEIIQPITQELELKPFEKQLNFLYMGCYNVNPVYPIVTQELGLVSNQKECIDLGKKQGLPYVALQEGNVCYGLNNSDLKKLTAVSRNQCNMVCDESSAGYCGGVLKNQIYSTTLVGAVGNEHSGSLASNNLQETKPINETSQKTKPTSEKTNSETESFKHLENFATHNKEMKMIDKNISQIDMLCQEPINRYNLFLSLLIIILLTYIVFEIIYNLKK